MLPEQTTLPEPKSDASVLFSVDLGGITSVRLRSPSGLVSDLLRDDSIVVENRIGVTIPKGSAVYISGISSSSFGLPATRLPQVALARSDSTATMPCVGITQQDIPHNTQGRVMTEGMLTGINTSTWPANTILYNSKVTAGALTSVPVAPPEVDQFVAVCVRSHASEGQILVTTQTAILAGMPNGYATLDGDSKVHDYQIKYPVGSGAALPTADALWRGRQFIVLGGAGVADKVHVCVKTATDTYIWVQIATG